MVNPMIHKRTGTTYDAVALDGPEVLPSGDEVYKCDFIPNKALRSAIADFLAALPPGTSLDGLACEAIAKEIDHVPCREATKSLEATIEACRMVSKDLHGRLDSHIRTIRELETTIYRQQATINQLKGLIAFS
jgi:hypothetical protein